MKLSKLSQHGLTVAGVVFSFSAAVLVAKPAHADAFSDRSRQSYEQQDAERQADSERRTDERNIHLIKKITAIEKRNGGVNSSMKCYSDTMDLRDCYIPVEWSARGYQTTIYSRYTLWWKKQHEGQSATNSIGSCHFETNSGLACSIEFYNMSPTCYNANHVRYEEKDGRLVRYVAPAPVDEEDNEPISACTQAKMDQTIAESACRRLDHSRERDACLAAVPGLPRGCQ